MNRNRTSSVLLGCIHYERSCHIYFNCCNKFEPCFQCHDASTTDHVAKGTDATLIKCIICLGMNQINSTACVFCKTKYAKYSCSTCIVHDSKRANYFHCNACGICRIGDGSKYRHCEKCNTCVHKNVTHVCFTDLARCPACLEDLKTSTKMVLFLPCGHYIHKSCHIAEGKKFCPFCFQKCTEATTAPLRERYADVIVETTSLLKRLGSSDWDESFNLAFYETEQLLNSKDMEHNIWNNIQREPGLFISDTGKYDDGAVLEKEEATMVIRFSCKFPKYIFSLFGENIIEFCVLIWREETDEYTKFTICSVNHHRAPKLDSMKRGHMCGEIIIYHSKYQIAFPLRVKDADQYLTSLAPSMEKFLEVACKNAQPEG